MINMEQFSRMDTDCTSHFSSLKKYAVMRKCTMEKCYELMKVTIGSKDQYSEQM
jgi:hypothetical protein